MKMSEKGKLNSAAMDGLVIALIVIVCELLGSLAGFLSIVLWIVKLVATIWVLARFMKKYSARHAAEFGITKYSQAFSYGFLVSLCSTIVIAVFSYLQFKYMVSPETMEAAMEVYRSNMQDTEVFDRIMENLPFIVLVGKILWCTILGVVYSAIIANTCVKVDFNGFDYDENGNIKTTGE